MYWDAYDGECKFPKMLIFKFRAWILSLEKELLVICLTVASLWGKPKIPKYENFGLSGFFFFFCQVTIVFREKMDS
jgi:hypothetical protein